MNRSSGEHVERLRARDDLAREFAVDHAADHERRGRCDAVGRGDRGIGAHRCGRRCVSTTGGELRDVEPEARRQFIVGGIRETRLAAKQCFPVFPEFPLLSSATGGHGGGKCIGMERKRQVARGEPHLAGIDVVLAQQRPGLEREARAVRALQVGEFDDRHRRLRRAQDPVVAGCRGCCRCLRGLRRVGGLAARSRAGRTACRDGREDPERHCERDSAARCVEVLRHARSVRWIDAPCKRVLTVRADARYHQP